MIVDDEEVYSALEDLSPEEAANLPPPRCPGRRPLKAERSIRRPADWQRIVRIALWGGAVLLLLVLISQRLLAAQPPQDGFRTLRSLPQRTQEIVAIVALHAKTSRVASSSTEEGAGSDFPAITDTPTKAVLAELRPWMETYASAELNQKFAEVAASEDATVMWMYVMMNAMSANNDGRSERQLANTNWAMRRMELEMRQNTVLWDMLLWGLISELTSDPIERSDLYFEAVLFAEVQFEQR